MDNIKYIIIDTVTQNDGRQSGSTGVSHFGYHFIINSQGVVNPIDISHSGSFMSKTVFGQENPNKCGIGIKYCGKLSDRRLRPLLIALLTELRQKCPYARILAKSEYDRWHVHVRDDMNLLRRELSELA